MLDEQLQGITTMVKQQVQKLHEECSGEMQVTWLDIEATHRELLAAHRELEPWLTGAEGCTEAVRTQGPAQTGWNQPKYDGSASWAVFHRQFDIQR
jgi:hypothetical protein